ncbi:hypothetical protein COY65_02840 [Candidatus Jorgensenbacteria bacterium CG_4_10_14_0_8_um_filter_39_13]|uniref:Uncharacterized protein n=2 Tax=Candidatus Joergenseniibacteriota TaxID=1752739 RepID=A0A2M7RGY2_9BACT|nr:MAG: hypothetical protein COV54_00635 [Candidatus Jorgensenbacteria bacterium CG11_big_fil_rev_8_21_14_0_20_38_23]PIY95606.1 MAG: hypothetical protein COY65_02840 [Candidatus Jorgensenbacteria bacterium CG_4_10_14_0_8_um_filter_39_13]
MKLKKNNNFLKSPLVNKLTIVSLLTKINFYGSFGTDFSRDFTIDFFNRFAKVQILLAEPFLESCKIQPPKTLYPSKAF